MTLLKTELYEHTLAVLTILFVVAMALVSVFMWRQSEAVNEERAVLEASQLAATLAEFRTLYTQKVVTRAKANGMTTGS